MATAATAVETEVFSQTDKAIAKGSLLSLSDKGNGERFALYHGDRIKYDWESKSWLYFDGRRWNRQLGEEAVRRCAKDTAQRILEEATVKENKHEREASAKHAFKSEHESRQNAMMSLARSEKQIATYGINFDKHAYLFNCVTGVINLENGGLLPHHQDFLMTKLAKVVFDETAECPLWLKCLDMWMAGDKDKIVYLQRTLGMCLTGDICARAFPIFYGPGKNGKSTCLDCVIELMGDYASIGAEELLAQKQFGNAHPTEIADLAGRRLVVVDETKEGMKLRTALVKRMTGDRMLKGRFMRQDYFDFQSTHKTILMTQNLPVISETSDAIWDRVHLVEWKVRIPEDQQDPHLIDKLRAEHSGILNWLIEGCRKWQEDGYLLKLPESVKSATQIYREESDPLGEFVDECCTMDGDNLTTSKKELRLTYDRWATRREIKWVVSPRKFNAYFRQRGVKETTIRQSVTTSDESKKPVKCWRGIGLSSNGDEL